MNGFRLCVRYVVLSLAVQVFKNVFLYCNFKTAHF